MSDKVQHLLRRIVGAETTSTVQFAEQDAQMVRVTGATAFALALDMRFGEEATVDQVQQFVARVRGRWVEPEALNPVLAESIILAIYQDSDLLGSTPAADVTKAQNLLTYALVNDLGITGEALEEFIKEATELMNADEGD